MKRTLVAATLVALVFMLSGTADAALQTRSMDAVEAEVETRDGALTGDLDKAQKKVKKAYTQSLKSFSKESTSQKKDASLIKKIVGKLAKALPEDAAMTTLLNDGLAGFHGELLADLGEVEKNLDLLDDADKNKVKAQKAWDKAKAACDTAIAALEPKPRAGLMKKAQSGVDKAEKAAQKAFKKGDLTSHQRAFLVEQPEGYKDATSCIQCHTDAGAHMLATGHWKWQGLSENIEGHEGGTHGKTDLINNFCIAIPSNEGRCTQCHVGYGWKDKSFDFADVSKLDCLVCHDTTGTYKKDKKTAGMPVPGIDLQNVAMNAGTPTRANCGACHFYAGGGDNVKHGDLASTLASPAKEDDVHMGLDGQNFSCQKCHTANAEHGIAGMPLHSVSEGSVSCRDCHEGAIHTNATYDTHTATVACQTCHIPAFSRSMATKMEWYWNEAGDAERPVNTDEWGKPDYDKMKGRFVWGKNVQPALRWFNGKWKRKIIGVDDKASETGETVLAEPVGSKGDGVSKIYPFKMMKGMQGADGDPTNRTLLVPHLFGMGPGPNPYWVTYNWDKAFEEGAAWAGQTYSGSYVWVDTIMYLSVNHEIAPKGQAKTCLDCHDSGGGLDWSSLGYMGNPFPMGD